MLITIISISLLFLSFPISADGPIPISLQAQLLKAKTDEVGLSKEDLKEFNNIDTSTMYFDPKAERKFSEKDFIDKCLHILGEVIGTIKDKAKKNPDAAMAIANTVVPGVKLVSDLLKKDHSGLRLWIQIGQISKLYQEYQDLIKQYGELQQIPKHEIDTWTQALQHRLTQSKGMMHTTAILQLGIPVAGNILQPILADKLQSWVTTMVAGSSLIGVPSESMQTNLKYVLDTTYEYCKRKWDSPEMQATKEQLKTRFDTQIQEYSKNSYVQTATQWAADKSNDLLGWFGYGSKSQPAAPIPIPIPQTPPIDAAASEYESDEGETLSDIMNKFAQKKGVNSVATNGFPRYDTGSTAIAESGLSASAARRLLDEESGGKTYTILMNLTIVMGIVLMLSVIII